MKTVYETSTSLEAHMIKNLLINKGLEAEVYGDYLEGGVGELAPVNLIRVTVNESHYDEAKQVIHEWESKQVSDESSTNKSSSNNGGYILSFVVGICVGAIALSFLTNSNVYTDGIDYNGDGVLDEKWTYRNNKLSKTSIDRNFDQEEDLIFYYGRNQQVKKGKADINYNGIFESTYTFINGDYQQEIIDTNEDGTEDVIIKYNKGSLENIEIIGTGADKGKKISTYKMQKLVSSKFDRDGDGVFETTTEYDYFENPIN